MAGSRFGRELVVDDAAIATARGRLVRVAGAVVVADLLVKALAGERHAHKRSVAELIAVLLVVGFAGYALPRAGSRRIATAAGLMVGAGVANVVSALLWRDGVPNPFALVDPLPAVAFNLADVAALVGFVLLLAGARGLSAPPAPPPRRSPPPPVQQTSPVRWDEPAERP